MADPVARSAAKVAAFATLPIALVAGLVAFWVLGGFSGGSPTAGASSTPSAQSTAPVAMPAPKLAAQPAVFCRALLAKLPVQLRTDARRPVTAGPEQNAAWGDPALTLGCGAGPIPSYAPTADLFVISGVCWYASTDKAGSTWTTVDRVVPVSIRVPVSYAQAGQWVAEFSAPILGSLPSATKLPLGCTLNK